MSEVKVNIIGAGLAGLSAAIRLAEAGVSSRLVSLQASERAQSVMAEGGINAALDTMGEGDAPSEHYRDTIAGGVFLADENAVHGLTEHAPDIVRWLTRLGAPFQQKEGELFLRNFGGQKKKRTAYSKSSTGKILMTALIDEARRYEAEGLIERLSHHAFCRLLIEASEAPGSDEARTSDSTGRSCTGALVQDLFTGLQIPLDGPVILASGGLGGLFPGLTTGTKVNTGDVTAAVFAQGVRLANLEFVQYHPTTAPIAGKRCLISEAARGEGGRLMIDRNGSPWYFMEELYPELGNLMPRDVVSREMARVVLREDTGDQVYLDMTHLSDEIWEERLSDLREESMRLLSVDPKASPIPVSPGIHFFMGGIDVNAAHETSLPGLYAAGECACQYHGANRLGGNSMLGAIYGGRVSAETILCLGEMAFAPARVPDAGTESAAGVKAESGGAACREYAASGGQAASGAPERTVLQGDYGLPEGLASILRKALGIFRNGEEMAAAQAAFARLDPANYSAADQKRILLAEAMLLSAIERRESRGAHTRTDFPERDDEHFRKTTLAEFDGNRIRISLRDIPERTC